MPTKLTKKVSRETTATFFEKSKRRNIILSLEPPCSVGFRLKGKRETLYLDADIGFSLLMQKRVEAKLAQAKNTKRKKR